MPAPKKPNNAAAVAKASANRRAERLNRLAEQLRAEGWLPLTPEQLAALPVDVRALLHRATDTSRKD